MGQKQSGPALAGEWRIVSTDLWNRQALDLVRPAFLRFDDEGLGELGMIALTGALDCRHGERDGRPLVEFTWEGEEEGDARSGRGWAVLDGDGRLRGRLFIHLGDDSGFVAERAPNPRETSAPRRPPRSR